LKIYSEKYTCSLILKIIERKAENGLEKKFVSQEALSDILEIN